MYQRDYILRMIEQMTRTIATQIMKLREQRKYDEALAATGELYKKLSLPNPALLFKLTVRQLIDMMTMNGVAHLEKLEAIATLFKEEAEIRAELGQQEESGARLVKALQIHLYLFEEDPQPSRFEAMNGLLEQVDVTLLTPEEQNAVKAYYAYIEQSGEPD
ncbi:hypothetical protein [Paenibacillus sp. y28]|uniref:hypothetical protein n=1 Tax=Paenibacillus sp. y28 TaxID=3129110 RepID=UPI0030164E12